MSKLKNKLFSHIKQLFKFRSHVSNVISSTYKENVISASIERGNLIRYARYIDEVENNINELKKSNPKYLGLINEIIETSITPNDILDVDVPMDLLLSQMNTASFYNQEALDFTSEVLRYADNRTAKYFLAVLANGVLADTKIKKHFKAATPFVNQILLSIDNSMSKPLEFIDALRIIVNPNADYEKIKLLPKVKYTIDSISKKEHKIDITKLIYSNIKATDIDNNLKTIVKDVRKLEKSGLEVDCVDYLIKNSL